MSPKFCCCLPLRLGALVISLLQFLLCGVAAGGFWYLLWISDNKGVLDQLQHSHEVRIGLIVAGSIYTFAALIGLFGFFGAVFKKNGLVRTHLTLLYVSLLLEIASGVFSLVVFYRFRHNDGAREDCIKGSNDSARIAYCNALDSLANTPVWSIWVSSIVPIVVVAYACYVVHNYSRRLTKQKADREIIATRSTSGPVYTAVKPNDKDESHPLSQPAYSYPYSDAPHSFGSTAAAPPASGHAASYYYSDSQNKV